MKALVVAAAAVLVLLAGCGAPDELSRDDSRTLTGARERLDDALDTEETLRTSQREARRIRAEVRRIVSGGAFEGGGALDEFGLAALGELQQVAPSLVEVDADGVPEDLDRDALRTFLRLAASDAKGALIGPARTEVSLIEKTVEDSGADGDTRVGNGTVGQYLRSAERDLRPVWPQLADRLASLRDG